MENEEVKNPLVEATIKALYDQLEDDKDYENAEGLVDDILVVTDPEVTTDEYEEVIERAQEIIDETPEGEIPFDETFLDEYILTCPICGSSFINDKILENGEACPICMEVPEAFVVRGKVKSEEDVSEQNGLNLEPDDDQESDVEVEEMEEPVEFNSEEEKVEASEEIKTSDNKLEENKEIKEEGTEIIEEQNDLEEDLLLEDKLNFKKYGIIRTPELDFSDDGNRFRMYECNGVPISYLKDDGDVFLSIRLDYLEGLTYDEYSKLPSYKDCDKYNYVAEDKVDLADVAEICKRVKAEYDAALKDIKDVSDDDYKTYVDKYLAKAEKEYEDAKNEIRSLDQVDLMNASEWKIKDLKRYLESLKREMERWQWENRSKRDQVGRRYDLQRDSEDEYKRVSFYLREIKEIIAAIKNSKTESLHENKETDIRDIFEMINENKEVKTEDSSTNGIVYTIKLNTKNMEDDEAEIKRVLNILAKAIAEHDVSGQTFDKEGEKCLEFTSEEGTLNEGVSQFDGTLNKQYIVLSDEGKGEEDFSYFHTLDDAKNYINSFRDYPTARNFDVFKWITNYKAGLTVEDRILDESKLQETGEWDDEDEEMRQWLEDMKIMAYELADQIKGEVKSVQGFDKYQGPKAIISTPNHGDLEMWFDGEDYDYGTFIIDLKNGYIKGGINDLAILLNQEEIPENEILPYEN